MKTLCEHGCGFTSTNLAWPGRVEVCRSIATTIEACGLQDCWKMKPLLAGDEVSIIKEI